MNRVYFCGQMNFRRLLPRLLMTAISVSMILSDARSQTGRLSKLMPIPERISGNFAEFRSNHFHAGIDYKTNEQTGYEVYAAADGFVSRVKVSNAGYGRALYITHTDQNLVTVYAHLSEYYFELNDSIRKLQYFNQQYEIEIFPDSGLFPVRSGQLIGYSGNSGSSEGPHLHFETRYLIGEKPFNPETTGYLIYDTIAPQISSVVLYTPGIKGSLAGSGKQTAPVYMTGQRTAVLADTIYSDNTFFIGFEGFDKAGMETNRLGFRKWKLTSTDQTHFKVSIDSFSFDETRLINSIIDYPLNADSGRTVFLCMKLTGNKLSFAGQESGIIKLKKGEVLPLKLEVTDHAGNTTEISFTVKCDPQKSPQVTETRGRLVQYGKEEKFNGKSFEVFFGKNSVYEDTYVDVSFADTSGSLSGVLSITPNGTAIHERIEIALKLRKGTVADTGKMVMVHFGAKGEIIPFPVKYKNGFFRSQVRNAGRFALQADTLAPLIHEPYWYSIDIRGIRSLVVPVKDDLSGVKNHKVSASGKWIRSEYNVRRKEVHIDERDLSEFEKGTEIAIEVTDTSQNKAGKVFRLQR